MARIKAPAELPELVRAAFSKARSSGDLHFFPTQVTLLNVDSIPVRHSALVILNATEYLTDIPLGIW